MIDLDYFAWREPTHDVSGTARLLVPRSNPSRYEDPVDLEFPTVEMAVAFREEEIDAYREMGEEDNGDGEYVDDAEVAAIRRWVLVHYVGTVVENWG